MGARGRFRIQPCHPVGDGQMLFLGNMLSNMKHNTPRGSRITEVHNGSSPFTGDAGGGESNVRRWIIENDWLEARAHWPLRRYGGPHSGIVVRLYRKLRGFSKERDGAKVFDYRLAQ